MKIKFRLQIHGAFASASSEDVYMYRLVEMPFPPFVGMEVSDGDDFDVTVHEVWWHGSKGRYEAFVESDKEIYNAMLHREPHRDIKEIVKEWKESGWKEDKG
jgi:G:T-mismatch repair DNA endonuclease (very short patch repair protein)